MIPLTVRYNLKNLATLYQLPASPYVHLKHIECLTLTKTFLYVMLIIEL